MLYTFTTSFKKYLAKIESIELETEHGMKIKALIAVILFTPSIYATEYQSFTNLTYSKQNNDINFDNYGIHSRYYFDKKQSLGPLDQFKFINTTSYIYGGINQLKSKEWANDSSYISGRYFYGKWSIGGGIHRSKREGSSKGSMSNHFNLGYLVNDNFLVQYSKSNNAITGDSGVLSMQYNHQISDTDYLGFSIGSDEKAAMTYFTHLGDERYVKVDIGYDHDLIGNKWSTNANYYFDNKTSIFANYQDGRINSVGAKYFLNDNFALSANYSPENSRVDYDAYHISLSAQF